MVHARPHVSTIALVAVFAATLVPVSTYGNELPPLLSTRAFPEASGEIHLTSATLPRQPFTETPEPLFSPTRFDDPWQAALPDRSPSTSRTGAETHRDIGQPHQGEPGTIRPRNATPLSPDVPQQERADQIPAASDDGGLPSLEDGWGSDLEPASFDDGLAVDILGIVQWTLIVLLLCAGCCVVILRRLSPNGPKLTVGTRRIRVLETARIAAGSSLQLVEIDSHRFLIALDGSGVKSVTGLPNWFEASQEDGEPSASAETNLHLLRSQPTAADPEPGKAA